MRRPPVPRRRSGVRVGAVGALAWALAGLACQKPGAEASRVVVRNPDYLVVRPIRREADAEHPIQVDLP